MWIFLAWLAREVYYVFFEPILVSLDWVKLGLGDASYGRDSIPYSPIERENIYDNPAVKTTRRRVFLSRGTPILDLSLGSGKRALPFQHNGVRVDAWINYYVWEMPEAVRQKNLNADVYLVHGINEYSGRVIPQAMVHMKNGFRTIAIDMPTYGRSSGLHSHLPTLRMNEGALDAVMAHVRLCDENDQIPYLDKRIRVAQGGSMGGFSVVYHAALHPPNSSPTSLALDGVAVTAPMLLISPETRPSAWIEALGRILSFFAGRLGLIRAIRGNLSDDPMVERYARTDKQSYHGLVRVDTGLAILSGLDHLHQIAAHIQCPIAIHHGSHDRVTDPDGSRAFYERLPVRDKVLRIWPGWEHGYPGMSDKDLDDRHQLLEEIHICRV
ncbi:acylglycerol lipase [Malassezia equina]|uniref:Acylglycerol lipase n=1 Tax=Malassezia equina TaxID=1381935 RepID=A0AAF0EFJ3_9BASI|nr:acylglycerol lipase [Malassezia equina]